MIKFKYFCPNNYFSFASLSRLEKVSKPEDADFILLSGGEDISPSIYGQENNGSYGINIDRDIEETSWISQAKIFRIPIVGICRGAQLLHAMNGGTLIQHLENHRRSDHTLINPKDKKVKIPVNSLHHQGIPPTEAKIMYEDFYLSDDLSATEAFFCSKRKTFGVQYHPEFSSCPEEGRKFFMDKLEQYII